MQKGQIFAKDITKEWVEYPLLAMPVLTLMANVNAQCERTLNHQLQLF